MQKIPKQDDGSIYPHEMQESRKEMPHKGLGSLYDEMLCMMSMASHDIRGTAVSAAAALKLIKNGFYGGIDESVDCEIDKLMKGGRTFIYQHQITPI